MMNKEKYIMGELNKIIPNPVCSLNYHTDWQLLIAVMLSAQCTDARVNIVTSKLFLYNLNELAEMEISQIEDIIKPVGTHHRKAIYIKQIVNMLINESAGMVPHDRKFVENLPGVGHKTCNVVFAEIFKEPTMPVDTHISRVSKRLQIANANDTVMTIENKIKELFPKDSWNKLHLQLVLFGRHFCKAVKPKCDNCPFNNICSFDKKLTL